MFRKLQNWLRLVFVIPGKFTEACNILAEVTNRNTEAVKAMHSELLSTIKNVETHLKYLSESERRELIRRGVTHIF